MITSKDNEKLKLVRKLAERKHREEECLFVTEGEDLLKAGRTAGQEPTVLLTRAGEGLGGDEVDAELLNAASSLASGTRAIAIWPRPSPERPTLSHMGPGAGRSHEVGTHERPTLGRIGPGVGRSRGEGEGALCVYLHGVGDPGNVGSILRSAGALADAWIALGPDCADPYGPKAVRASMGAIFAVPVLHRAFDETPSPRISLVAHGGAPEPAGNARTICLGAEREGLPESVIAASDARWTIPMQPNAVESLGVAAAAAIALSRIGSPTGSR